MALDIPSNQIYAGRYHYQEQKAINILNNPAIKYNTEHKLMRDEHQIDKVTISDQAFALSKDWREASKDNPNINRVSYDDVIAEHNKLMNTTNLIDPISMFNSEISSVSQQIRDDLGDKAGAS